MTNLLPAPDPPTPTSSSSTGVSLPNGQQVDPKQELEWKGSLRNLEYQIQQYKETRTREGQPSEQVAEEVAAAMEHVADTHTDPKVKKHWREKARAFRTAGVDERDGILEEIGKGFLILLTTPFLLVGAVLQAAGGILHGVGTILKGLGRLTRKLSYTGSSVKKDTPD